MRSSLYSRLFRYAASSKRSPLENFITEALADVLDRLSKTRPSTVAECINHVLLHNSTTDRKVLMQKVKAARHFRWETQEYIGRGSFDISLWGDGGRLLVIENKLGAGLTTHATSENGEEKLINQLEFYGRHLARHDPQAALVLLTQGTPAPEDFLLPEADRKYAVKTRAVCQWYQLIASLRATYPRGHGGESTAIILDEFLRFCEEKGMDDLHSDELAAVSAALSKQIVTKVNRTLDAAMIALRLKDRYPALSKSGALQEIYWRWFYPFGTLYYVGLGFAQGGENNAFQARDLPDSLLAFVFFTRESGRQLSPVKWIRESAQWQPGIFQRRTIWLRTERVTELAKENEALTDSFVAWIRPNVSEAMEILKKVREE